MFVRDKIDKLGRMDFRAEVSLLKTVDETDQLPREAEYGERGSIRIDALEHAKNNTACVYDIKTGKSGLLLGRAREIAATVKRNFPTAHWTIVTEVRPRR